jgi:iron complex transport system substrate-binding protein
MQIKTSYISFVFFTGLMFLLLPACSDHQPAKNNIVENSFLPSKYNPLFAHGFKVYDAPGFRLLEIYLPWDTAHPAQRFCLVDKKDQDIVVPDDATVLHIPLKSMVCFSATHLSFADALGMTDKIIGVLSVEFVVPAELHHLVDSGKIVEVGAGGHYDIEKLIGLNPQIIMVSPQKGMSFDAVTRAGLTVMMNGDFLENTPLGRAEWIKVTGLLFGREREAMHLFDSIVRQYNRLKALTADVADKPVVLSGKQYSGFWNIPGGKSYVARFIEDAGGRYLYAGNTETGSITMDFEAVYHKAMNADFWRFVVYAPEGYTLEALTAEDIRYGDLPAVKNKKVFVCNTAKVPYYQKGLLEPQIILADYINILHPGLLPHYKNKYYHLLP